MLDSLVRVTRRVLRVPETVSSQTFKQTRTSPRLHGCDNRRVALASALRQETRKYDVDLRRAGRV